MVHTKISCGTVLAQTPMICQFLSFISVTPRVRGNDHLLLMMMMIGKKNNQRKGNHRSRDQVKPLCTNRADNLSHAKPAVQQRYPGD